MPAYLKGEKSGRSLSSGADSGSSKRTFYVISDDKTHGGADILDVAGLPLYGDQHPRNAFQYADSFSAKQDAKAWWKWTVEVSYKFPDTKDSNGGGSYDNPLNEPPEVTVETEIISIAARGEVDTNGMVTKAIANSAGEPYDPHPEEDMELLIISVARNEAPNFSVVKFYDLNNSVNSNSITFGDATFPEGTAKLKITVGPTQVSIPPGNNPTPVYYRRYNYSIIANKQGFDLELLDWGTYYKDGSDVKKFLDEKKEFGLLDGSGGKLADGGTPMFNKWKNKKRADFAQLNLPNGP